MKEALLLIESSKILTDTQKQYYKKNFCIFWDSKKKSLIDTLNKTNNIHFTKDDINHFEYGIKLWKKKKIIQGLESKDND